MWTPHQNYDEKWLDNYNEFILSQPNLKCLPEIILYRQTENVKQFLMRILNFPLKAQRIFVFEGEDPYSSGFMYTLQDLFQLVGTEQPNMATEELELKIDIPLMRVDQLITLIAAKFPNLRSITILNRMRYSNREQKGTISFSALSSLQNLESLEIDYFKDQGNLNTITIPTLKHFHYEGLRRTQDFNEFLSRHKKIQELFISNDETCNESFDFGGVVNNALRSLEGLSRFILHFRLLPWTSSIFDINSLIRTYAKPGFVFMGQSMEIMKRYDNEVVQKINGKWQKIQ